MSAFEINEHKFRIMPIFPTYFVSMWHLLGENKHGKFIWNGRMQVNSSSCLVKCKSAVSLEWLSASQQCHRLSRMQVNNASCLVECKSAVSLEWLSTSRQSHRLSRMQGNNFSGLVESKSVMSLAWMNASHAVLLEWLSASQQCHLNGWMQVNSVIGVAECKQAVPLTRLIMQVNNSVTFERINSSMTLSGEWKIAWGTCK
jgi:hypothetical protein